MKKSILAVVLTVGVLASGAYAYNQDCQNKGQQGMKQHKEGTMQKGMQSTYKNKMMSQKGMHKRSGKHGGMQMISQLNLSDDQKFQLSILKDEMKLNMKKEKGPRKQGKMLKFIGDNGFDKGAFQKNMNAKHQTMSAIKADHMEKVFKLLTKEQIADLKIKLASK